MTKPRKKSAATIAPLVDTADPADAERGYAKHIEGWNDLSERQRRDIIALSGKLNQSSRPLQIALKRPPSGALSLEPAEGDHPTYYALKMTETFASPSLHFAQDRLNDLVNHFEASNNRGASNIDVNSALALVHGAKPQNEIEATLAVQMAVAHDTAMRALRMMGKADFVPQMQTFGNLANKLLRTFAMHAETLSRMQRGGEQVVRHIHVDNRGGQAVIAEHLHTGGRETAKNAEQSYAPSANRLD